MVDDGAVATMDREDAIGNWLDDRDIDDAWQLGATVRLCRRRSSVARTSASAGLGARNARARIALDLLDDPGLVRCCRS